MWISRELVCGISIRNYSKSKTFPKHFRWNFRHSFIFSIFFFHRVIFMRLSFYRPRISLGLFAQWFFLDGRPVLILMLSSSIVQEKRNRKTRQIQISFMCISKWCLHKRITQARIIVTWCRLTCSSHAFVLSGTNWDLEFGHLSVVAESCKLIISNVVFLVQRYFAAKNEKNNVRGRMTRFVNWNQMEITVKIRLFQRLSFNDWWKSTVEFWFDEHSVKIDSIDSFWWSMSIRFNITVQANMWK